MNITLEIVEPSTLRIYFEDKATAIYCNGLKTTNFLAVNTRELSEKHHLTEEEIAEIQKVVAIYNQAHPDYRIFVDTEVNLS